MTDQEIKDLTRKYAEANPPQTVDEGLRQFGIFLNATEVFEPFLRWLLRDYYIVNREKVKGLYDCYKQHEVVTDKKGLHEAMLIARGSMAAFRDIFGQELFVEKSEK